MDIPICTNCGQPGAFACHKCGLKYYCSLECMDSHNTAGHFKTCLTNIEDDEVKMSESSPTQGTWLNIVSFLDFSSLLTCKQVSKGLLSSVRKILCKTIPDFFPQKLSLSITVATAHHFRQRFTQENSVLIAGGSASFNDNSSSVSILKFLNNQLEMTKIAELKESSSAHALVMGNDGCIYVLGGVRNNIATNHVQRIVPTYFNPRYEGTLVEYCQPMSQARCNLSAARGIDGSLYAIGGSAAFFKTKSVLNSVEIRHDSNGECWVPGPQLNVKRAGHSSGTTSAGLIFIVGGFNGSSYLNSVEYLDPSGQWIELPSMEVNRSGAGVGYTSNGFIYVIGGLNDGDNGLSSFERYDFREGKWQALAPMANRRFFCSTAVTENYLYVIGGFESPQKPVRQIEVFDFRTELWQTTQVEYPFCAAGAISLI